MLARNAARLTCLFAPSVTLGQPTALDPAAVVRYDGHKLVQVDIRSLADLRTMQAISPDHWNCAPRPGPSEFRIPPGAMPALEASGLHFVILDHDLQLRLDAENARLRAALHDGNIAGAGWFDDYKTLAQISAYLDGLVALRPDLATRFVAGASIEGREIFGMRIANDAFDTGRCKPALFLNSCQHAREWISPMVTMYAADQLVRLHGSDPLITDLVNTVEFIIVPVANPDGYEYTWNVDRFWRKNRRDNGGGKFGVDLNRNWGFMWGLDLPGQYGGNSNPGSETYWGTAPFSEPETQVLRDLFLATPQVRWHNDIHSYGQLILQPWGWTPAPPPDHALFNELGAAAQADILAVHGKTYVHGTTWSKLYPMCGGASDWFYGGGGVGSFLYELRGPGFDPPPSQILPCAEEVLPAMLLHAEWIRDEFPFVADWNGDCVYDLFDFLAYLNSFNAAEPGADLYGDGKLDLFDFLEFVNLFNAGK